MNPLEGLAEYLDRLERRLRLFTWTRGAAAIAAAALVLTVVIVALLMMAAFSPSGLVLGRFGLALGIGAAAAVALVIPLFRMNRRRAAGEVERRHPGFDQRLVTFTERADTNASDPFLPLLAEDALKIARDAEPSRVVENRAIIRFVSLAAAAASALVWLMFWGPGVFGYGTSLLWGSLPKEQQLKPFYSISVQPGSKTIRRKTDLMISAQLTGFSASKASVFARYASSAKWEEAPMERQDGGSGFRFLFVAVPEDVEYYVEAGSLRSSTYRIHTVDLPAVKNIVVTYKYPSWTGLQSVTEDPGGDLRAVEGTVAHLEIQTDRPLANGQVIFEDGKPIHLDPTENNKTRTTIPIQKDGTYHIAVMDNGELVRLTDDYFIEARKPGQPAVRITKPGRDAKVSPIEEVTVEVTGEDEYPLDELTLHYSVNGEAEKTVPLLKQKGAKQVTANTLLALEDFKLVPGDIVSLYATARDGRSSARTDMYFIQAVPFEYNFSQSQQGGGGGGGMGEQQQQISDREKEIIAATFNQIKGDAKTKAAAAENGKYLSEVQGKLRDQAQSLANRMKARQLDGSGAAFQQFVKEMEAAVAAMSPASDKLKGLAFNDALTPEQQALQHLLRAESVFRDIQISISRGGGGGGGAAGGARDLANLFDLELDKDKNQYETSQNAAAEQRQQQIDDALKKLQELARRQQELAQQQNPQNLAEQRYQQEMLRREAEQLRREMEQLQRGDQNQQGQSGEQGQQQGQQSASNNGRQSGQSGQQGQQRGQQGQQQSGSMARNGMSGGQQANNEQLQQAIRSIEQAAREMADSASARQPGQQGRQAQSQADAQRAAERLKQAEQTLEAMRHQQNGSEVSNLANQAEQLAGRQQEFEQKMRRTFGQGMADEKTGREMAQEKQSILDSYMQLQKGMQQTSRNLMSTQPDVSKQVRDALSRTEQSEVQSRMEWAEAALRQGMGQYAVMREAPVTGALNQLRDDLKKAEAGASAQSPDDKQAMATQQALNQAERVRREIERLARAQQARAQARAGQNGQGEREAQNGRNGQGNRQGEQSGNQPGSQQARGSQSGANQQPGNQPGGQQPGSQQQSAQNGRQSGNQPGGQQSNGQQSGSPQGGSPQGGQRGGQMAAGGWNNGGARNAGAWNGGNLEGPGAWENRSLDGVDHVNPQAGPAIPTPGQAQVDYDNLIRDLGRLRNDIGNDRDLARQYQQLLEQARRLDPNRWATSPQLAEVINNQVLTEIDEVELMLRRKAEANEGSVRGANPRNPPPGYADAIAEYYRKLSKQ